MLINIRDYLIKFHKHQDNLFWCFDMYSLEERVDNFLKSDTEMRKLIDIKIEDEQPLKILAVKANKDLKNYIQDILSDHVLNSKK